MLDKIKPNGKIDKILIILIVSGFTIILPFIYIVMLLKSMLETAYGCITDAYVWNGIAKVYKDAYTELKK